MKKFFYTTALAISVMAMPSAFADDSHGHNKKDHGNWEEHHEERQERRLEKMTEELNLSASQRAQVKSILDRQGEKKKAAHDSFREKMKALKQETDTSVKAVLTSDQKSKYEQMQKEREAKKDEWLENKKNKGSRS